jgi:uncharacterized membrane protein HdeD (DUF308 family)
MLKHSSFVSETSYARLEHEKKYYIAYAALLFVCGVLFLIIPVFDKNGILIFAESWLLLCVFALALLRPLFYSRGVADVVMGIITGSLYLLLEAALGSAVNSIGSWRLAVCIALFLAGTSRILAYARMIVIINLPLMPICGLAEMTASVMIFVGWPGDSASMIYWFLGMTVLLAGFESLTEAAKLRAQV